MTELPEPQRCSPAPEPLPISEPILEFTTRAHLPQPPWRYTARPRWSSAGESIWMRLSKFSLCNRLSVTELVDLFSLRDENGGCSSGPADLRCIGRWNREALASTLEISASAVRASFCTIDAGHVIEREPTELRYCEACLVMGFHAAWFQWLLVERCPVHDKPFRVGCVGCAAPIPYVVGIHLASSPLRCMGCLRDWVPSLAQPGGHSRTIEPGACQLMLDWADYVRQVATVDHRGCRDRGMHQFVVDRPATFNVTKARPHVLTMMNRLFEAPPPTLASHGIEPPSSVGATTTPSFAKDPNPDARDACFDPLHWPHFGGEFARYESTLHSAQAYLFAASRRDIKRAANGRLLLDGLVAPTTSMHCDAAAATGWAVSWLGPSQALAPPTGFAAPPCGLTAWLCKLPLRPRGTSRTAWREQVMGWLVDDMVLSASRWADVAEFMSTRGFYLLYGEAVSPLTLALRHHSHVA